MPGATSAFSQDRQNELLAISNQFSVAVGLAERSSMIQLNLLPDVKLEYIKAQRRTAPSLERIRPGGRGFSRLLLLLLSVDVAAEEASERPEQRYNSRKQQAAERAEDRQDIDRPEPAGKS